MRITTYSLSLTTEKTNVLVKEKASNYTTDKSGLCTPGEITDMMRTVFDIGNKAEEFFYVIAFTSKLRPIGVFEISHGASACAFVSSKAVFSRLLLCGGTVFIAVHNHPSGDCSPSKEDIQVTEQLKELGIMLDLKMADHIIISDTSYYSFKENELL